MLEEAYGKAAMKKMQVYEQHKCFHGGCASVNGDPCCGLEVCFDALVLSTEYVPEGQTVDKGMYPEIVLHLRDQ
jgi:hypothetical protein